MQSIKKAVLTLVLGVLIAQCGCVNVDTKPKTTQTPAQNNAPSKYQGDKSYYAPDRDNSDVGPGNTDWDTELTK